MCIKILFCYSYSTELSIGYGVILFSTSAVLVLLLGIVPMPTTYANTFLIDNFTADGAGFQIDRCDQMLFNKTVANFTTFNFQSALGPTVIDGIRECQLVLLQHNPPSVAEVRIDQIAEQYVVLMGAVVQAMSYLQYDGIADSVVGPGNPRSLNLDLTNSNNLRIVYSFVDFDIEVKATLIDGGGDIATLTKKLVAGTTSLTELNFPINNFVVQNAALSLNDIDEFNFNFTAPAASDFVVEFIDITMINGPVFAPDHYFGYVIGQKTIPKFSGFPIVLADQFENQEYEVVNPQMMFNPAMKNKEPVHDTETHLKKYKIRGPHEPVLGITLTNQFETLVVNTKRVDSILVPTAKSHTGPTNQLEVEPVDHYKCYKLELISREKNLVGKSPKIFDTNFEELRKMRVLLKPLLCNPVEKIDLTGQPLSTIKNPDIHLTCYKVKPRLPDEGHDRVRFDTNNQFGPEDLKTRLHDVELANGKTLRHEFCVPTMKTLGGGTGTTG